MSYQQTRTQSANKAEAYKLLQHGIDSSNEKQAISLILAIESDYGATIETSTSGARIRFYTILGFGVLTLLSFCPGTAIGLWRGSIYVTIYRWWMGFVLVSIPFFVFGAFVRPWIMNWLTKQL
jgi:hypothetical protein